jgi:hypothetical protein
MGEKAPERLFRGSRVFRDDGAAALERVARLEDENRQLRAELSRLERPARDAETVRTRTPHGNEKIFLGGFLAATGMFGVALMTFGAARHPTHPRRAPAVVVVPADPVPLATTAEAVPAIDGRVGSRNRAGTVLHTAPAPGADCTVPFWYDERGVKHYKKHCLTQ